MRKINIRKTKTPGGVSFRIWEALLSALRFFRIIPKTSSERKGVRSARRHYPMAVPPETGNMMPVTAKLLLFAILMIGFSD
jgi:hypothetical protein